MSVTIVTAHAAHLQLWRLCPEKPAERYASSTLLVLFGITLPLEIRLRIERRMDMLDAQLRPL